MEAGEQKNTLKKMSFERKTQHQAINNTIKVGYNEGLFAIFRPSCGIIFYSDLALTYI